VAIEYQWTEGHTDRLPILIGLSESFSHPGGGQLRLARRSHAVSFGDLQARHQDQIEHGHHVYRAYFKHAKKMSSLRSNVGIGTDTMGGSGGARKLRSDRLYYAPEHMFARAELERESGPLEDHFGLYAREHRS
jgi:hypothetical protein